MDINIHDLPTTIYACFVLNGESISEEGVAKAIAYDRAFQPAQVANEIEGKRVRFVGYLPSSLTPECEFVLYL